MTVGDRKDLLHGASQIDLLQILRHIRTHELFHVVIQTVVIIGSVMDPQRQDHLGQLTDVISCHRRKRTADELPVTVVQLSHHAEIQPYDLSVADAQIADVRIRVKKAVMDDLFHVVIRQLGRNFPAVISFRSQRFIFIDPIAVDVFHDQHPGGGDVLAHLWHGNVTHTFVETGKPLHEIRLVDKIHLLFCRFPEFIQQDVDIDHAAEDIGEVQQPARSS